MAALFSGVTVEISSKMSMATSTSLTMPVSPLMVTVKIHSIAGSPPVATSEDVCAIEPVSMLKSAAVNPLTAVVNVAVIGITLLKVEDPDTPTDDENVGVGGRNWKVC